MTKLNIILVATAANLMEYVGLHGEQHHKQFEESIGKTVEQVLESPNTESTQEGCNIDRRDVVKAIVDNLSVEQILLLASNDITLRVTKTIEMTYLKNNPELLLAAMIEAAKS